MGVCGSTVGVGDDANRLRMKFRDQLRVPTGDVRLLTRIAIEVIKLWLRGEATFEVLSSATHSRPPPPVYSMLYFQSPLRIAKLPTDSSSK